MVLFEIAYSLSIVVDNRPHLNYFDSRGGSILTTVIVTGLARSLVFHTTKTQVTVKEKIWMKSLQNFQPRKVESNGHRTAVCKRKCNLRIIE